MKVTKQFSKPSLSYLIKDFLFLSVASFILIVVITFIENKSFEKFESPLLWVILLGVALIGSIVQGFKNRDGVLIFQEIADMKPLLNQVDLLLSNAFTREVSTDNKVIYYRNNSKLKKFLNWILQEHPRIEVSENSLSVFARGELLKEIESKINMQLQA